MVLLTEEEIAKHNTEEDCWIVFKGKVYEVSHYLEDHPGGVEIITDLAGQDCTEDFEDVGHSQEAYTQLDDYYIGDVGGESTKAGLKASEAVSTPVQSTPAPVKTVEPVSTPKPVTTTSFEPVKKPAKAPKQDDGSGMMLVGAGVAAAAVLGYFLLVKKK